MSSRDSSSRRWRVSVAQGSLSRARGADITRWAERHQIALYLGAIASGLGAGWVFPASHALGFAVAPVIGVLLYATFLGVPFTRIAAAFRDVRFLIMLLVLNFVIVPVVVFVLSRFVADDDALLVGVLLVLLAPCVDYVIVFTGLAGGSREKLVAAAPLLMIVQLLILPAALALWAGDGVVSGIDGGPFVEALVFLIAVPLLLATATQVAARRSRSAAAVLRAGETSMVGLMIVTLFIVVASQAGVVARSLGALGTVILLYVAFLVVMTFVGVGVARVSRLDAATGRAVVFSGVTRNSLVVLPLALALPAPFALVPAVVVAQTLVELVAMVLLVPLMPVLLPHASARVRRRDRGQHGPGQGDR